MDVISLTPEVTVLVIIPIFSVTAAMISLNTVVTASNIAVNPAVVHSSIVTFHDSQIIVAIFVIAVVTTIWIFVKAVRKSICNDVRKVVKKS